MIPDLNTLSSTETVFWCCAVGGTLFFLLKVLLSLVVGLDHDGDMHGHMDLHAHDAHATTDTFKIVSLYSIGAFIMMFGWVGLTFFKQYGFQQGPSIVFALVAGFFTMVLTAYIFKLMTKLTSPGAAFAIQQTVGKTARVYQKIPGAHGKGVIQITLNGVLREVEAVSLNLKEIDSFCDVVVDRVVDSTTVAVKKVTDA